MYITKINDVLNAMSAKNAVRETAECPSGSRQLHYLFIIDIVLRDCNTGVLF